LHRSSDGRREGRYAAARARPADRGPLGPRATGRTWGNYLNELTQADFQAEQKRYLSTVTKEAGFAFTGKVFGLMFGFIAQAVYARLLGADMLGVFVLAWSIVTGFALLSTLGFEFSLVRYVSKYESSGQSREARSVFLLGARITVAVSVVGVALLLLLRTPLAFRAFHEYRLQSVLAWMSLAILPFGLMRLSSGALRGLKDIKSFIVGFDVFHRISRMVVFVVLYWFGLRLYGMVGATVVATCLAAGLLFFLLRRRGPFLFDRSVTPAPIPRRSIVTYSSAMLADAFVAFSMQHSGRLVLGIFLESSDVGVYNIAALLATLITFILLSFNTIFSPVVSDLFHRERMELLGSIFRSVTRWTIILSLPLYLWILVAGETTLAVFGREFVRGNEALLYMATGLFIAVSTGPVGVALAMTGHQKWNVYNAIALAVVSIGLNVVLVPRMGIAGAGVAAGIAQALVKVARLVQVRFLLKLTPYDRSSLRVTATVMVTVIGAILFRTFARLPRGLEWSFIAFVACALVVGGLTAAMGVTREDRLVLAMILRKIRRVRGGSRSGRS
jgi:O-antigen/teichoic acid export membrane protein